ncbi:MAG: cytidine deaminase [Chloroflexia bacterium]|nr:cytidine deaminase [Chloroflexia bacterium]
MDETTAEKLLAIAREAAARAYVPYSRFPVGAAALAADGSIYAGANIENASYPLTCCAERVAVFQAVMAGQTAIVAIAVWAKKSQGVTPCGACRQVLNEWRPDVADMVVIVEGVGGPEQLALGDLLPRSFGPRDLAETRRTP